MSCSILSCSTPAPSARPLPVVSGRSRSDTHRVFEKNAALIWATMARRFPSLLADENASAEAWSAGAIGLLHAAEHFDAKKGAVFSTYAVHCIEGELRRFISRQGAAIHRPAWLAELDAKVLRAERHLRAELGRAPTDAETGQALGIPAARVAAVRQSRDVFAMVSLDALKGDSGDGGRPLGEMLPDTRQEAPGARLLEEAGAEALLAPLTETQRRVIEGLFLEERTVTEMAPTLGISRARVGQLRDAALGRMRKGLDTQRGHGLGTATRRRMAV